MMEITNCTFLQEFTTFLIDTLKGCQNCGTYALVVLVTMFILYHSYLFGLFLFYIHFIFLVIYKKIYNLPEDTSRKEWKRPRYLAASAVTLLAKVLHGYEVYGLENLPEGPGLIIYYHGCLPTDYTFFVNKVYITTGRFCLSVIDNFLHNLPGSSVFQKIFGVYRTREECVEMLKKGYLIGVAPGGLREQNYGDNTYKLIWGKRKGFAQVAIDAKVPIIPMFTQNIQEGYRTYGNIWPMRWLYERTRCLFFPAYGFIPVKLRTYIGEPIPYDPNITAEELAVKTKMAVEALRDRYQKIPGNIARALWERFEKHHKDK
ncbi:monoacylglycerol/Diacylglycerol O-acyltransferase-like [Heteronotia binoei]|uniref:monoacylglycerol/Diacylglycerol O-acyltransferase-like n=1 Tax=Heteronotia binoei TaxID=13085 RepID=UPI0029317AB3|nr:monoacylglycerol/Diacylglycerol O-acyltransferase-like [Heteronotia binoei]